MSWSIFKNNVVRRMASYTFEDNQQFADVLASEYDFCMKRGYDIVNKNPIKKGNKEGFAIMIRLQQSSGVASTTEDYYTQLFPYMGNAVKSYWSGAQLMELNPPIVPPPGGTKNLNILPNGNLVTIFGEFGNTSVFPISDIGSFVNAFIYLAKSHLTTIGGICNVLTQYPPPAPPAPGIVNWAGYTIPDADGGQDEFTMTETEIAGAKEDIKVAETALKETKEEPVRNTAKELIKFMRARLATKQNASTDASGSLENPPPPPPPADAEIGNKIVYYAKLDIGKMEDPLPPGKPENWGAYVQSCLKSTGLTSPAFWCAAFVTKIYKSAGASNPSSAGCDEWRAWAKKKGLWSREPAIGAAILYGSEADAHHIGIVESFDAKGNITTIEGNTSGGGFSRNGVGVFRKRTTKAKALGFVIPQDPKKAKK